jgi:hypothetical protein
MCQPLHHATVVFLASMSVPKCGMAVTEEIEDRLCGVQVKARLNEGLDGG